MFSLGAIQPTMSHNSFVHGTNVCNGKVNGMQAMIMQSQTNVDKVIPEFEAAIAAGLNPNDAKASIFNKYNLTDADFTDFDAQRLVSKVESMYKANYTHR
jgi:hypothetical protein